MSDQPAHIAEEPTPEEFDPGDTARRVAEALWGKRWPTVCLGGLEVVAAESASTQWPICLHLTVEGDRWSAPREFLVDFGWESTYPGNGPDNNAHGLADEAMIRIEEYLETGPTGGLTELTVPT